MRVRTAPKEGYLSAGTGSEFRDAGFPAPMRQNVDTGKQSPIREITGFDWSDTGIGRAAASEVDWTLSARGEFHERRRLLSMSTVAANAMHHRQTAHQHWGLGTPDAGKWSSGSGLRSRPGPALLTARLPLSPTPGGSAGRLHRASASDPSRAEPYCITAYLHRLTEHFRRHTGNGMQYADVNNMRCYANG